MKRTTRRKGKLVRLGMALAVALSVGAAPHAIADGAGDGESKGRAFSTEGDCTESVLGVVVDAATAQALLPGGFVVQDVGGKTLVIAFAEHCLMSVDGHKEFATTLSGTAVNLNTPAGSYDLTWNSDKRDYYNPYNRLGIGSLIPESHYETTQLAPAVVHSEALIPGDFSFSFDSNDTTSSEDPLLDDAQQSVHWGFGHFGAVRGTYPHDLGGAAGGIGVLQAEPGSPLARIIGTDPVEAPGLFLRFHFRGTVELANV